MTAQVKSIKMQMSTKTGEKLLCKMHINIVIMLLPSNWELRKNKVLVDINMLLLSLKAALVERDGSRFCGKACWLKSQPGNRLAKF